MIYNCAKCKVFACENKGKEKPENCPMHEKDKMAEVISEYMKEENNEFFITAAEVEKDGYTYWNRVRETIEMCRRMNYTHIGIAFCSGLLREAKTAIEIFENHGIKVSSIMCKAGGNDKTVFGISEEAKIDPGYEPACNPIGQARFLADQNVDFVVVMGLCVGHDSLFYKYISKYTDAFCTTLVVKDRVTGNNPCAALYGAHGYFKGKFGDE